MIKALVRHPEMWFSPRCSKTEAMFAGLAASVILFTSTGCGDAIKNSGEDNAFIRESGIDSQTTGKLKLQSESLLPTKVGSSWRNKVTIRRIAGPSTGSQDPNVDDHGNRFPVIYERAVAGGMNPLAGGGNGLRIDIKQERQASSKRTEVYDVGKRGISLSSIDDDQSLAAVPPLPLVNYPIHVGEVKKWTGVLRLNNKPYPSQGYSRVGSLEEISLPQGAVTAYRIDTVLSAAVSGRQISFPMTRWFAPGVGIIRQRFISGNLEVTKETVSYKI